MSSVSAAPHPDPFPETCIEIDGGRGTLRLKPGYDLQVDAADGSERRSVAPAAPVWATPPWQAVQESVVAIQRHWLQCLRAGVEPATSD